MENNQKANDVIDLALVKARKVLRESLNRQMVSTAIGDDGVMLTESGMSKIFRSLSVYDIAILTAFRYKLTNCAEPTQITGGVVSREVNLERNRTLKATLLRLDYGVTPVDGRFIENVGNPDEMAMRENSYLVTNLKDDPGFFDNPEKLGRHYCQESILLKPKGEENAFLLGCNRAAKGGLGSRKVVGGFRPHSKGESTEIDVETGREIKQQAYSTIKGQPFTFGDIQETYQYQGVASRKAIHESAASVIKGARLNVYRPLL